MAKQRKWLPTLGELIDRLSISSVKRSFYTRKQEELC